MLLFIMCLVRSLAITSSDKRVQESQEILLLRITQYARDDIHVLIVPVGHQRLITR